MQEDWLYIIVVALSQTAAAAAIVIAWVTISRNRRRREREMFKLDCGDYGEGYATRNPEQFKDHPWEEPFDVATIASGLGGVSSPSTDAEGRLLTPWTPKNSTDSRGEPCR